MDSDTPGNSPRTPLTVSRIAAKRAALGVPAPSHGKASAAKPRARTPRDAQAGTTQAGVTQSPAAAPGRQSASASVEEVSAGGMVLKGPGLDFLIDESAPRGLRELFSSNAVAGSIQAAVIARLNRAGRVEWCLPKGHLEGSETFEQAALREVFEETGLNARVMGRLGSIDYWYNLAGKRIHKTVHHFLMRYESGSLSIENDPDRESIDVAWVPLDMLRHRLTFSNERRIAELTRDALARGDEMRT